VFNGNDDDGGGEGAFDGGTDRRENNDGIRDGTLLRPRDMGKFKGK